MINNLHLWPSPFFKYPYYDLNQELKFLTEKLIYSGTLLYWLNSLYTAFSAVLKLFSWSGNVLILSNQNIHHHEDSLGIIHFPRPHHISLRYNLILSFHLHVGLLSSPLNFCSQNIVYILFVLCILYVFPSTSWCNYWTSQSIDAC